MQLCGWLSLLQSVFLFLWVSEWMSKSTFTHKPVFDTGLKWTGIWPFHIWLLSRVNTKQGFTTVCLFTSTLCKLKPWKTMVPPNYTSDFSCPSFKNPHILSYLSSRRSSFISASPALEDHQDESHLLEPFLHELPLKAEDGGRPQEEDLLPHMILPPDGLDMLEKAQRKMLKKKRRNKQKRQRNRHFNDLWVRIEER